MLFVLLTVVSISSCKKQSASGNKSEKEKIESLDNTKDVNPSISSELLDLEDAYAEMLSPISEIKSTHPKTYWFIVSWLRTNYRTPKWKGYLSSNWKEKTKVRGIDCSGFARVMQDQIFRKKIRGGSQGILNRYCRPKKASQLKMGDLVFFRAHRSKNNRIVHVGVYLQDGYFVHATSRKSAAKGLGLNINSLDEKMWSDDFVTGGEIK